MNLNAGERWEVGLIKNFFADGLFDQIINVLGWGLELEMGPGLILVTANSNFTVLD